MFPKGSLRSSLPVTLPGTRLKPGPSGRVKLASKNKAPDAATKEVSCHFRDLAFLSSFCDALW